MKLFHKIPFFLAILGILKVSRLLMNDANCDQDKGIKKMKMSDGSWRFASAMLTNENILFGNN